MSNKINLLTENDKDELISILKNRFEKNMHRHPNIKWENVYKKLENHSEKLTILYKMEKTGGEPDVTFFNSKTNEYTFIDCSKETPKDRRNVCYDREALDARKEFKPLNSAIDLANEIGIEILTEEEYRDLQKLEAFDLKTSSWIKTPESIRKLGGALFCDCRYNHVFLYHNGASSYYGVRGFRGSVKV